MPSSELENDNFGADNDTGLFRIATAIDVSY